MRTPLAAIVGVAERPVAPTTELTHFELVAGAAREAMLDAGCLPGDIDGLLVATTMAGAQITLPAMVAEYVGVTPTYCDLVDLGGASAAGMVWRAAAAIAVGACTSVLCVLGETRGPWAPVRGPGWRGLPIIEFEGVYGRAGPTTGYALVADRHAARYGTTDEQRAAVVVAQRRNAAANPLALHRDALTVDDVLASPLVCAPLRRLEVVRPVSGASAFVVTDPARAADAPRPGVWPLGFAERITHAGIAHMPDLLHTPVVDTAHRAYAMAGVEPADIDVAELYDCYTITVILTLEDAGFCAKGEGGPFVATADFGPKGRPAINTNGGQLCMGQAGVAGGATHLIQAVRQLRGTAGPTQVPNCQLAFVNGNGGVFGEQCSLVLGSGPG